MSSLAWIDFDEAERQRAQRIMSLFQERESRDELGLGGIRDSIADHLFPGTSTIQTRLRYILFIPWLFQMLEGSAAGPDQLTAEARALENRLANALKAGGESNGIIGRDAGSAVLRLPSSVYWAGLSAWGIRLFPGSIDSPFSSLSHLRGSRPRVRESEDATSETQTFQIWTSSLPARPADLLEAVTFRLALEEAQFIIDQLVASQPRSLLTFLARTGGGAADCYYIWEHPHLSDFPNDTRALVAHSELFSSVMHGASLFYNLLLSELRAKPEWVEDYQSRLQDWRASLDMPAIRAWSLDTFWQVIDHPAHRIRPAAKRFVDQWLELVRSAEIDGGRQAAAARVVEDRERRLKTSQSRFANRTVRDRWTGASGVDRLSFRRRPDRTCRISRMLNRTTLDPETRVLYGDSLQPPPCYVFDAAVATTFSLDFETALAAPVSLALFAAESRDDILSHPLALLEGAERIAGRLVVFADAGHLHAQGRPRSRLCSLLERIIVEVAAPRGGAFHPKMWALRYRPTRAGDPTLLRLLVLSRNLTRDRCWDISLRLDGELTRRPDAGNRPLFDLLSRLPDLAVGGIADEARALTQEIAQDIRRARWTAPERFDEVSFALNGFGGSIWQPPRCARLGVISPFCDTDALDLLADLPSAEKPILISRPDQLVCVEPETLAAFERVSVLDEMAASEDGEEVSATALQGLHAKAFIAEIGWDTVLTIGSGNATRPALLSGNNVELFASLKGKRSRVGTVEQIMGEKGFGRLTRSFVPSELEPVDPAVIFAERRLDEARRALCRGALRLRCERVADDDAAEHPWRVWLTTSEPLPLKGVGALSIWPITRGDGHACEVLSALRSGEPVDLGAMPMVDLTRFLAFRLVEETEKASSLFSTGLVMDGLPAERHAAILRWAIDSRDAFFRYLRLLLSELGEPFSAALAAQEGAGAGAWATAADDAPLLEDMVRALCRDGERLRAIERLMTRLEAGNDTGADPIPDDFRTLWDAFRIALQDQDAVHGG